MNIKGERGMFFDRQSLKNIGFMFIKKVKSLIINKLSIQNKKYYRVRSMRLTGVQIENFQPIKLHTFALTIFFKMMEFYKGCLYIYKMNKFSNNKIFGYIK
jgi:hypothetical protein